MSQKNIWLKISEGIKGEGTHEGYADQIQIDSYAFGASNVIAGNRQAAGQIRGQVSVSDFTVNASMGLHSAPLFKALTSNQNLKEVIMTKLTSADKPTPYMIVTLSDCFVSSFASSDSGGSGTPGMESISFNYGKIHFKYILFDAANKNKGGNEATYDATKGKAT
ncbi:MAG: type VI secretion system tube protein Hcp [Acidobacteria bacterium]|nr:type VI secretion system tube protein Hcp [Acidobacteriota bacterium]